VYVYVLCVNVHVHVHVCVCSRYLNLPIHCCTLIKQVINGLIGIKGLEDGSVAPEKVIPVAVVVLQGNIHICFFTTRLFHQAIHHFWTLWRSKNKMVDIYSEGTIETIMSTHPNRNKHWPFVSGSILFPVYRSSKTESGAVRWTVKHAEQATL